MLRIAIVAHGRYHAFDLARELRECGHDVALFSNYPTWAVERFGIARDYYTSHWAHGGTERLIGRCGPGVGRRTEAARHLWFGRWAARALEGREWDVVHCWSGVSEELLESPRVRARCRVLMRGSAHIGDQAALLAEEERRVGVRLERPSPWMIAREEREYALADRILVLSEFARASFERHGIGASRVTVLPLGVDVGQFQPSQADVDARVARILGGNAIRVLFVGTLSARKGLRDLVQAARACEDLPVEFTLVGPGLPETRAVLAGAGPNITVLDRREQHRLPGLYGRADVFMFPTIEDGFGMVLTQAAAAGLVILSTPHCAAPEILHDGAQGWILPIRDADAVVERLRWCHEHRIEFAAMLKLAAGAGRTRTWRDVASSFAEHARAWASGGPRDRGAGG